MHTVLDHLVFGASSLEDGTRWLETQLGVPLSQGGEHVKMGTHNRLLRIGEQTYLELIAIDPNAHMPGRPRWFGLDGPEIQTSLMTPRLLTWALQTDEIERIAGQSPISPGAIHAMSRNSLNWLITIPDDGALIEGGAFPSFIQWLGESHPAEKLPLWGVSLNALELGVADPARFMEALQAVGFDFVASKVRVVHDAGGPRLKACLTTPKGIVRFDSLPSAENRIVAAAKP